MRNEEVLQRDKEERNVLEGGGGEGEEEEGRLTGLVTSCVETGS